MPIILSRYDAKRLELKRFYTGIRCSRNHDAERYVSTGGCAECHQLYQWNKATTKVEGLAVYSPNRALSFATGTTALEAQLAFRYIVWAGWHNAAVEAVRADPAIRAQMRATLTTLQLQAVGIYDAPKSTAG